MEDHSRSRSIQEQHHGGTSAFVHGSNSTPSPGRASGGASGGDIQLKPADLKNLVLTQEVTTTVAPILVLINGLPDSGKSDAIVKLLGEIPIKISDDYPHPKHGLSFYELVAVAVPGQKSPALEELEYIKTTSDNCYLYAAQSVIKQRHVGVNVQYTGSDLPECSKFSSNDLNVHLLDTFFNLQTVDRSFCWERGISRGLALINMWDIGLSRTIYHFLPALNGLLHNSYSWLFFDLQRDGQNFEKVPAVSNEVPLMKWRSRIHYLLRDAKLSESNSSSRKNVCSVFAMHDKKFEVNEKRLEEIKLKLSHTASQIGVKDLLIEGITTIDESNCMNFLKDTADKLVIKALEKKITIPLSFIFLRSIFYKDEETLYIKRKVVKAYADELKISDEKFTEFCKLFTSIGSIIDVTLIDPISEYIIMKPNLFLEKLHELFHTKNEVLVKAGILTLPLAEDIFGPEDACAYTDILVSLSLAVKLKRQQFQTSLSISDDVILYLPDVRTASPLEDYAKPRKNTFRLLRSSNAPRGHLQVSFVAKFLEMNLNAKLCARMNDSPTNVTTIRAFDTSCQEGIEFDVVYFGFVLEFRIKKASKEVFTQIIQACHNVMHQGHNTSTKYNFAVVCSKDPNAEAGTYELTRERHLLPNDELCQDCKLDDRIQGILLMWNKVLREDGMSVPTDRKLNGDPISFDDACFIAKKMEHLRSDTYKCFAEKLGFSQDDYIENFAYLNDWKLPMIILIEWERQETKRLQEGRNGVCDFFSKRILARKLMDVASEVTDAQKDCETLHEIARFLDNEAFKLSTAVEERQEGRQEGRQENIELQFSMND